jgi:hypothetical protein
MKSASCQSLHWTDEQLIASLYEVGPANNHLDSCGACVLRRSVLLANREKLESLAHPGLDVSFQILAGQRRAVYKKLEARSAVPLHWRRWAPVALTVLILGSAAALYDLRQPTKVPGTQLSDAQLALEVSRMSQDWQAEPTAPLQALFE